MPNIGFWAIAGAGGGAAGNDALELIQTQILTGTATSISFSSIPSTYKHLQIRFAGSTTSNGWRLTMTVNGVTSGYTRHNLTSNGSAVYSEARTSRASIEIGSTAQNTMATEASAAIVDILDYASTSKYKTVRGFYGAANSAGNEVTLTSGLYESTTAISSLSFAANSGTFAIGTRVSIYGVKGV